MIFIDSRNEIGKHIVLPPNPVIAEIGVFRGDFSLVLSKTYQPSTFYLVDPWEGLIFSGDVDGNNGESYDGDVLYEYVKNLRFQMSVFSPCIQLISPSLIFHRGV